VKERLYGIKVYKVGDNFWLIIPSGKTYYKIEITNKGWVFKEICVKENREEVCEPMGEADGKDIYVALYGLYELKKKER